MIYDAQVADPIEVLKSTIWKKTTLYEMENCDSFSAKYEEFEIWSTASNFGYETAARR